MVAGTVAKMATQEDLNQGLKLRRDCVIDVEWLDACSHMNVEKLHPKRLSEWLCVTHTVGRVVAQDEKVMCVATNFSAANGIDMIAIPIKWIESIRIMEAG